MLTPRLSHPSDFSADRTRSCHIKAHDAPTFELVANGLDNSHHHEISFSILFWIDLVVQQPMCGAMASILSF